MPGAVHIERSNPMDLFRLEQRTIDGDWRGIEKVERSSGRFRKAREQKMRDGPKWPKVEGYERREGRKEPGGGNE